MRTPKILSIAFVISLGFTLAARAQSNAVYDLSHNVVSGGGSESGNALFSLEGTVGQAVAGVTSGNALFGLHGGFWSPPPLAPTASSVSVAGRVNDLNGGGNLRRVKILLTDSATGALRTAQPNQFGYYRFDNVEVGRVYLVRAESANFQFTPDTHVFTLRDARDDLDFTALRTR